ncbi:acetyl-CoA carboxylase biotin carboxyl carrier protein subunit [Nannocystis sp. ILAH1]|uniref:acetyl-CoA carboxylase biotin carboxyl carrier protein subunit n=1 Tax=unclassified Nannocystis TaxID=2627009 RepID=UPI002271E4F0|nr:MULTISPECIES: acetyl-CoA carboxylase biotin carboxyl carrier protein subunit [unclassified Nannocystis]MCY0989340.1 acetyl-CoA carboxylase biotin carboxyl carrier protein subunit [Nannocystis sp. ILAH1]MCY1064965.1 acetyl-CoA carboxylase biotin carboxyl carrier protein subunit [Nannocystis sp. RBIL2]
MAKVIKAHITGNVWKIEVKVGDPIEEGTVVTILEVMKMEMPVEAEDEGTITKVLITEEQAVREGEPLFEYE